MRGVARLLEAWGRNRIRNNRIDGVPIRTSPGKALVFRGFAFVAAHRTPEPCLQKSHGTDAVLLGRRPFLSSRENS
jgi:hypothetical protein